MPVYTKCEPRPDGTLYVEGLADDGTPFTGVECDDHREFVVEGDRFVCRAGGAVAWSSPIPAGVSPAVKKAKGSEPAAESLSVVDGIVQTSASKKAIAVTAGGAIVLVEAAQFLLGAVG